MFETGEYISYGATGICRVEGVTEMDISDSGEKREYYILKPVYEMKRTIYCPVHNSKVPMRRNLTQEETYDLLKQIPSMDLIQNDNKKLFEARCKEAVMSGDCREWSRLIKTLVYDRRLRRKQGRKITSTNERYLHEAEDRLYGELAVSLNKEKEQVAEMVKELLGGGNSEESASM